MAQFAIKEIIEMAIQTERLGYQFYTEMAEKFKDNEGLVKLFGTLASKEVQHEKTFAELKDTIGETDPDGWEEAMHYFRAFMESEFFLGKDKALTSMDNIKSVKDAVNFALGFEKETLLYFVGVKGAVKEKEIVEEIINEEKSHIMWLNRFRASFE